MARALHRYGASADRIETALYMISEKLKIDADYFSLPTSIMASFKTSDDEFTRMLRMDPGKINLEKLYIADRIVDQVIDEKISITEGIETLEKTIDKDAIHADWLVNMSLVVLAFSIAIILGGSLFDAILSGAFGLIAGLFNSEVKIERIDTISEAIISFIVGFISVIFASKFNTIHPNIVILASLIYYVPGLSLTMAIGEVSSQNLTAGTARLMGAIVILLKLGFGAYLGSVVAQFYFTPLAEVQGSLGALYKNISLGFVCLSLVVCFQARWQETIWILIAGTSTFLLNQFTSEYLGSIAAALIAGAYIGAGSNLFAKILNRPSMTVSLPAIILLVPGSVGFKALEFLFGQDAISGINTLFTTFNLGIALVAGTYFGSILIKPKRTIL
jgi:uncharacterized membrane protein YjjP (DUF1212 family)